MIKRNLLLIALLVLVLILSGCAFARIDPDTNKARFIGWGTYKSGEDTITSAPPIQLPTIKGEL